METSGTAIPGYTIIRNIGSGGSAEVYLAVQQNLNRRVALKLVKGTLTSDPKFGERFQREGRIIAQLSHPHIIPVYDIGEHDGRYYMAMEYLAGGDLRARAEQLTLADLLQVIVQITQALQAAHAHGFVHRDIKPANILFRDDKQAVLTDFGIARPTESLTQMTVTGAMLGTPAYMSPEQINGDTLDGRTDLYALGVTLFEMLAGYQPYRGETMMSVAMLHTHAEIPRLPRSSAQMQGLIDRLLAKDPQQRINNAEALESELQDLLDVPDKLSQPLTSLWPDKIPKPDNTAVTYSTTRRASGKPTRRWLFGTVAVVVLIVATVLISREMNNLPTDVRGGEVAKNRTDSQSAENIEQAVITTPAVAEPPQWQEDMVRAGELFEQGRLLGPGNDNALALYRQVLLQDSGNVIANNAVQSILRSQVVEIEQLIVNQSLEQAQQRLIALDKLWPEEGQVKQLQQRIDESQKLIEASRLAAVRNARQRQIDTKLQAATAAMIAGNYLKPEASSAVAYFNEVLELDSENDTARRGLVQISDTLIAQIRTAISSNEFAAAESLLEDLRSVDPGHAQLSASADSIASARTAYRKQQAEQQRRAELKATIDKLSQRNAQWRLSNESLDAQSIIGDELVADITRLLAENPQNSELASLQVSVAQRLEQLAAQQQAAESTPAPVPESESRKPIVGGF